MSAWESIPDADEFDDAAELEEYMQDVYRDLRLYWYDRKCHDRDGWFAEEAGSDKCLALGHKPDPEDGWRADPDDHPMSWDGDPLCIGTRCGEACTQCEGECDFEFFDAGALWEAVGSPK